MSKENDLNPPFFQISGGIEISFDDCVVQNIGGDVANFEGGKSSFKANNTKFTNICGNIATYKSEEVIRIREYFDFAISLTDEDIDKSIAEVKNATEENRFNTLKNTVVGMAAIKTAGEAGKILADILKAIFP